MGGVWHWEFGRFLAVSLVITMAGCLLPQPPANENPTYPPSTGAPEPAASNAPAAAGPVDGPTCTGTTDPPLRRPTREGPLPSNRLLSATSTDAIAFSRTGRILADSADSPDLVVDGAGTVRLYFVALDPGGAPTGLCVGVSDNRGATFDLQRVQLTGFEGMSLPDDPDVHLLEDGRWRMYASAEPAEGGLPRIYTAESTDGITFERRDLALWRDGRPSTQPVVYRSGTGWFMYASANETKHVYASSQDGVTFGSMHEVSEIVNGWSQRYADVAQTESGLRLYKFDVAPSPKDPQTTDAAIRVAKRQSYPQGWTSDGPKEGAISLDPTTGLETAHVANPSVAQLSDGTYLMVYATVEP